MRAIRLTIFIVSLILCFFLPACGPVDYTYSVNGVPVGRLDGKDIRQECIEKILVGWVYDNSTRISMDTTKEIVSEVMKTKYPLLMLAIIELESIRFTPGALSSAGAIGWCQINYAAHGPDLIKAGIIKEKRDLWNTAPNIRSGEYIYDLKLKEANGNAVLALEGYLGKQDGSYTKRILSTLSNLYVLTRS